MIAEVFSMVLCIWSYCTLFVRLPGWLRSRGLGTSSAWRKRSRSLWWSETNLWVLSRPTLSTPSCLWVSDVVCPSRLSLSKLVRRKHGSHCQSCEDFTRTLMLYTLHFFHYFSSLFISILLTRGTLMDHFAFTNGSLFLSSPHPHPLSPYTHVGPRTSPAS